MMKREAVLSLPQAIEAAKRETAQLTGLKVSSVIGARRNEENGLWEITMELLERRAIPDSMDLLGVYDVMLNGNGEVVEVERKGHRKRGDTDQER
jgi:hypothetical protein